MEKRRTAARGDRRLPSAADEETRSAASFRRLDAIQQMVRRREQRKGGCVIGNLSTALGDTHDGFRRRLSGCFDEMAREFQPHLDAAVRKYCPEPAPGPRGAWRRYHRRHRRGLDHAHPHPARPAHDGAPLRLPEGAPTAGGGSRLHLNDLQLSDELNGKCSTNWQSVRAVQGRIAANPTYTKGFRIGLVARAERIVNHDESDGRHRRVGVERSPWGRTGLVRQGRPPT